MQPLQIGTTCLIFQQLKFVLKTPIHHESCLLLQGETLNILSCDNNDEAVIFLA